MVFEKKSSCKNCIIIMASLCMNLLLCDDSLVVAVQAQEHAKVPLLLVILGRKTPDSQMLAELVAKDLAWSGQFHVDVTQKDEMTTKQQMEAYAQEGHQLVVFIERQSEGKWYSWRLYDTTESVMLKGKKLEKKSPDAREWAHEMANDLWPLLTGQEGLFSTKIAYCKEVRQGKRRSHKYLCVADYDGSNEQVLVPTMVVAPRWGHNGFLFYSECTNSNVRLMYLDEQGKKHVASNFDGLNMQPSFSRDGNSSVYCASRGRGNCQIYFCSNGIFKQLTHNKGTNVSPTITADGSQVYFCSDFKTGNPGVYIGTIATGAVEELIPHGLCPSFCQKNQKLAYIKNVRGLMQIFVYDPQNKTNEQITYDKGNKDECSWSACGNYLIYAENLDFHSRIVALNIFSKEKKYLTSVSASCSYPCWSDFKINNSLFVFSLTNLLV